MTAVLENVNKFSYLGLRRRPTYNEVIGLIKENEALANPLPNRDATFFKASNEGSFFDGLDHLEVLKEQQQRILQRQVQDLLLRQNVRQNGGTYHLERHRQQSSSDTSSSMTPMSIGEDRGTLSVGLQADLQRREAQLRDRQQQTGEAHGQALSSQSRLPTLEGFLQGVTTPIRRMITPLPIPSRQPETIDLTSGDVEDAQEQFFPEMMTAREGNIKGGEKPDMDKKQELIYFSLQAAVPDADVDDELNVAFKVLDKFKNIKSNELVRNKTNRDEVFRTMVETGYITQPIFNQYLELVAQEKQAKGQENKEKIRNQMGRLYIDNIYNKFIAPISVRKGAESKAMARKPQEADTGARSSMG